MLTARAIHAIKPEPKQFEVTVGQVPGLRIRISPDGTKSFTLLYRHRGKKRRLNIGRFPNVGLAEARIQANAILTDVRSGTDPRAKKDLDLHSLKSVEQLLEAFLNQHTNQNNKPATAEAVARILRKDIVAVWADRDVRDITRADARELIESIASDRSPFAASNVFRNTRTFFNWLIAREVIEASPFIGMKDPAVAVQRDRVLEPTEIAGIWRATYRLGRPWDTIVRMLFLTARRRGEVGGAGWQEFNFKADVWTIPAVRTKAKRISHKPITDGLRRELDAIRCERARTGLLFPSNKDGSLLPASGFSKAKRRLDALSGVSDWRLHDIRRTVATNLAGDGVTDNIIARILDHKIIGVPEVTGIYNRYQYIPEMHEALSAWERKLLALAKG